MNAQKLTDENSNVLNHILFTFETKLINKDKKNEICYFLDKIRNNTFLTREEQNLIFNLKEMLDDHNEIINQSIQCIKSLKCQNKNLKEYYDNLEYKNKVTLEADDLYGRYLNTEELQCSKNDKIKMNYDYSQQDKNNLGEEFKFIATSDNLNYKNYDNCNFDKTKYETEINHERVKDKVVDNHPQNLEKIKLTNEILKIVNERPMSARIWRDKFNEPSYKDFLTNLINYNFNIENLEYLKSELIKSEYSPYLYSSSSESFSNYVMNNPHTIRDQTYLKEPEIRSITQDNYKGRHRTRNYSKEIKERNNKTSSSFENGLRNYSSTKRNINTKPFNRYTRLHGNYFEKNLINKTVF